MEIVRIGAGVTEEHPAEAIGGKAANLAHMAVLGLPVPPAFVVPISLCTAIVAGDDKATDELADGLAEGIAFLEKMTGTTFGDRRRPLLVSVRSGAARSMPGMLDTVLDVGCTWDAVRGLVRMSGHPRFAWDCRRRFLESYADVVLGVDKALLARRRDALVAAEGAGDEQALDGEALERLAQSYEQMIEDEDRRVPDDPMDQLKAAAEAVYRSWTSDRARTYRRLQHLDDLKGTAVTVQAMVFGNRGPSSGAGVAFSRDPSNGAARPVIDVLFEAQGEDVVSGRRNPETEATMDRLVPAAAQQLRETLTRLERDQAEVQDVEFTIEDGKLWVLQTRAAKRTPLAALRFAVDFAREGLIGRAEALRRMEGIDVAGLVIRRLTEAGDPAGQGTGASAGVAVGRAVFDSESAGRLSAAGDAVILLRPDTSTADIAGFAAADGIVTAAGGRTAHAALVARQMGKPCIVGCAGLAVDPAGQGARIGGVAIKEGDWLSIDGETGTVYLGRANLVSERPEREIAEVESWRAEAAGPSMSKAG